MSAKSKSQQRLFGMVHAYQKGELENPSDEIKDIAKSISKKDAEDFAETKHKGLPNKVKKTKRITEAQLREIISESIRKAVMENWRTAADAGRQAQHDRENYMLGSWDNYEPGSVDMFHDMDQKVGSAFGEAKEKFEAQYGEGSWDETKRLMAYIENHPLLGRILKSGHINDAFRDYYRWKTGKDFK